MHAEMDDAALVSAARQGDRTALALLVERHRPTLLALCRRSLGDSAAAEDAAQEAALQAMLCLGELRQPDRFGPWLCGIGLNVCRRWLREAGSRRCWSWEALSGGWQAPEPADWRPGPEEAAEEADLAERVRRAVAELPGGQRAAVLLFYLSGLTHAEVAAQLGIEVGAVKTRLHKARSALRRKLEGTWREETMAAQSQAKPVEMRVADVRRVPAEGDRPRMHVVVLEEVGGARRLPIWIGQHEGETMAMQVEKVQPPRPQTYAFVASLLGALGNRLRQVIISKLADNVFYAMAVVDGPGGAAATVDCRPSDAINLALAVGAPIQVEPAVLGAAPPPDPFAEGTKGAAEIVDEILAGWPYGPAPTRPGQP